MNLNLKYHDILVKMDQERDDKGLIVKMVPEIGVYNGTFFNFLEPEKSIITKEDIAHALSNICRYTGHCRKFYSVAQHCVLASYIVPAEHAFQTLMHDAAEAYIGDISTPLKQLLPDYQILEEMVEAAVMVQFNLSAHLHVWVKQADAIMLVTEMRDLMGRNFVVDGIEPLQENIIPWSGEYAEKRFLQRFEELYDDRPID